MRLQIAKSCACLLLLSAVGYAGPPIELELATERGVQITAPHEWLQLLASIGVENVRIRGMRAGDEVQAVNRGTAERPRFYVLAFLTTRDQLRLPGGTFSRAERAGLKDYFDRLVDDGAEALTAPRGPFGLTAKELDAVTADLAQPIDFETKGQPPIVVLDKLLSKFEVGRSFPDGDNPLPALERADPIAEELQGLTAGTGLAILLRNYGLVLRPVKTRGQPVAFSIMPADGNDVSQSTLGVSDDQRMRNWPIGWKPDRLGSEIAPALFEPRNAEIEGYTLKETLIAIGSRVNIPFFVDHAALRTKRINPADIQVRLARTRSSYMRVLDRVLAQARLHCQLRVDEAGKPFLWITR
jgi:hypothetical protein